MRQTVDGHVLAVGGSRVNNYDKFYQNRTKIVIVAKIT